MITTPDQRVRVFVSSTLAELARERAAAREAIEGLRLIPVMFELGARAHPAADLYRAYLEQSDVFVGIYGEQYGWVAPGMDVSGLEDELRLAAGKPRLLYVKHPAPGRDARLESLIRQIEIEGAVSYRVFADAGELRRLVADDLALLLSERFQARPSRRRTARTKLPAPVDPFVGRDAELGELERQLRETPARLVTVTGPGGVGKTRLALEVALRARPAFAHGAHFVSLGGIADAGLVASVVQSSLELPASSRQPVEAVVDALADAELLLLLDNFEHVLPAAPVVARLLEECPRLCVLITSRAVLKLRGEREFPVPPLRLPGEAAREDVAQAEAVALFVERALAVKPSFLLADDERGAVAEICRRLDGLPLAIELAAAQMRLLSPDLVLERLEDRLDLGTRRSHAYPDRQRTLRAAIEWSYTLLDESEKALFARAGVFRGGWTLEAIEAVCGASSVDTLASLVEQSLVVAEGPERPRFSMLPTIREYAVERLDASAEAADVRRRHAEFYCALALRANLEAARVATDSSGRLIAGDIRLDLVLADQDNLRAALDWSLETGAIALGLELATVLEGFWITGNPREGMRRFRSLLAHPAVGEVPPEVRARALLAYGSAAHLSGDVGLAHELYGASLALFEGLGNARGRAVLLYRLGLTAMERGELDAARRLVEESRLIQVRTGDRWGETQSVGALGAIAREGGDPSSARQFLQESVGLAREIGARWWEGGILAELGALAVAAGDVAEAEARAREALAIADEIRDRAGRVFGVGLLAAVAAERGRHEHARRLWSAVEAEDALSPLGGWQRHRDVCASRVLAVAGAPGDAEGRPLSLDDAVFLALDAQGG